MFVSTFGKGGRDSTGKEIDNEGNQENNTA